MIDIKHNVITNKSNWQEANLLEELNLARGRGGGLVFAGYVLLASQNLYLLYW